ncbi:HAD hydrolase-like protein [Psychrobacillus sp. FJAT-51614]|uniref:HAD hydrolase-like protein n=1 Tax=Psychrobacillus mangrovi TaxID=3117745 RepID=A0ABU8F727_9BACI
MEQAIIFDMDGTLFRTNLILEPALEKTFNMLRKDKLWIGETPINKYREIMGVPLSEVWKTLCPNHSIEIREKSNDFFQEKLIELIKNGKGALYPYTEMVLEMLSGQYELYIASNGQEEYLKAIINTYELNKYIKKIYSIQSIPSGHKSELVKKVLQENNIINGAVVGDRLSDINAAKDNGLVSIGVNFDFAQSIELEKADIVIDDLRELISIGLRS